MFLCFFSFQVTQIWFLLSIWTVSTQKISLDLNNRAKQDYFELPGCGVFKSENFSLYECPKHPFSNSQIGISNFDVSIDIFSTRKHSCLLRLLKALNYACYPPNLILNITIWIDISHGSSAAKVAENFKWFHGHKKVTIIWRSTNDFEKLWLNFWNNPNPTEIRIILEENSQVSLYYFYYLMDIFAKYFKTDKDLIDAYYIMGISLSSYRYDEVSMIYHYY